jgi:hypothetical protein
MQATTGHGALYIVILAIDIIAALLHSVAAIADHASPSFSFSASPLLASEPSATNLSLHQPTPLASQSSPGDAASAQPTQQHASTLLSQFRGAAAGRGSHTPPSGVSHQGTPKHGGADGSSPPGSPPGGGPGATASLQELYPQTPSLSHGHPSIAVSSSVSLGRDATPVATLSSMPTPRLTPVTSNLPEESPASVSLPITARSRQGISMALFQGIADTPRSAAGMHDAHKEAASPADGGAPGQVFATAAAEPSNDPPGRGWSSEGRIQVGSALPESRHATPAPLPPNLIQVMLRFAFAPAPARTYPPTLSLLSQRRLFLSLHACRWTRGFASQVAQEETWRALPEPTVESSRSLVSSIWQPAVEVRSSPLKFTSILLISAAPV